MSAGRKCSKVSIRINRKRWIGISQYEVVDGRGENSPLIQSFYDRKEAEDLRDEINEARTRRCKR